MKSPSWNTARGILIAFIALTAAFSLGRITAPLPAPPRYQIATMGLSPGLQFPVRVNIEAGTMETLQAVGPLRDAISKTR
jgi:hypothetical protein